MYYNFITYEISITVTNAFQKILDESNHKPNKIWVDKGGEFYNRSMKSSLQDNNVEMYSIDNEGKSVVAERFIRALNHKIYKYMASISKNVYIDKLDDIVNKYNNTYHRTIKMKSVDVKSSTYININKGNNKEGPKVKAGDYVKIFLQKSMFQVGQKLLLLKKLIILCHGHMLSVILTVKKLLECFMKKNCKKQIKKSLDLRK